MKHQAIWKYIYIVLFLSFGIQNAVADKEKRNFTLVIDAGHGGHDGGAKGAFSKEKNINLAVALAFGRLVEENCPDVKVIYTRKRDVFIPLQRRADIANSNHADLFISIHTNALPKGAIAYGSETYTLGMARASANLEVAKRENSVITLEDNYQQTYKGFNPNKAESYVIFELMQDRYMKQSVDLARSIQRQYRSAGRPDKGVHQAGFLVLRNTSMPSVLTELGFISTPPRSVTSIRHPDSKNSAAAFTTASWPIAVSTTAASTTCPPTCRSSSAKPLNVTKTRKPPTKIKATTTTADNQNPPASRPKTKVPVAT